MSGLFERDALEQVLLPQTLQQTLMAYSAREPSVEVCGLIGGIGELAVSFYATKNTAPDPQNSYFMDPQDQIKAMKHMRERGEQMLAIFHSHPHSPPEPSATDLALAAYPGVAYLIASLMPEVEQPLRAFLYTTKTFEAIDLVVVGEGPEDG